MIEVSGFSVERFVNMAAFRGIYIWDICPKGVVVQMKVSREGCELLDECAKKTGCQYQIMEERGLPAYLKRYQKRKILAAGGFFFIVGLYVLSSFVWVVEVQGNERISQEEILQACENMGLRPGVWKMQIDTEDVTEGLLQDFSDIAWVSVKVKGTNAQVHLVETIPEPEILDKETPSDLIAKRDGVILSIVAEAGTPLVQAGDVVEKGDLLISGEVILKDVEEEVGSELVRARGTVKAKIWEVLEEELPLQYTEKEYTGEWKKDHSVILKDSVVNLLQPNLSNGLYDSEKVYEKNLAIGDFVFPVALEKKEYKEYKEIKKSRTVEEAEKELEQLLNKNAKKLPSKQGEVLEVQISFIELPDKVKAKAEVALSERIDVEQKIDELDDRRNALDEQPRENPTD